VPRGNTSAIVLGVVSSTWVALWLLSERDPPVWPALLLALAGLLLVALTHRRHGWSWSSSVALILCTMPLALRIGGA
jgi:hypothetical protein